MLFYLVGGLFAPALIYLVILYYRWIAKFPRGPFPVPGLGNALQVKPQTMFKNFEEFAKQFGSVFTVFIPVPIVVLSDYETVKEAFITKGDDFVGRPISSLGDALFTMCENGGIINSNGDSWKAQRATAVTIFKQLLDKNIMENKVKLRIRSFLQHLEELSDKDNVELRWPVQIMISNIINDILFGFAYDYNDCQPIRDYVDNFVKFMEETADPTLLFLAMNYKLVEHLPIIGYQAAGKHKRTTSKLLSFIRDSVTKSLESYDTKEDPDCYAHAYKQKMNSDDLLNLPQLQSNCADLFVAGQVTTANTLRFGMLYLALNQDIQDKLRSEIHAVVGTTRLPAMFDEKNMPYTAATVLEMQRKTNLLPLNVLRTTVRDTEVKGIKIPAGTIVNGDLHNILANDPIFHHPERFWPERFLTDGGRQLNQEIVSHCIPFSLGHRRCAGEALARVELFLCLATMVQQYRILPPLQGTIDIDPLCYAFHSPKPNFVRLIKAIE